MTQIKANCPKQDYVTTETEPQSEMNDTQCQGR